MKDWFYNPKVKKIANNLKNEPEDWIQGFHVLRHKSGLDIWISNGFLFLEIYQPVTEGFGLFGKIHIWFAILRWQKYKRKQRLAENQVLVDSMED